VTSGSLPNVASSDDTALIVFTKGLGDLRPDIGYRRVTSDGTFLDASDRTLVSEPNHQRDPAAAWDGTRFLVEWVDDRSEGIYEQLRGDLFGGRIELDGTALDAGGFAVANDTIPETQPFVSGRDGTSIIGGTILNVEPGYAIPRIGYRISGTVPASAEEGTASTTMHLSVSPNPSTERTSIGFQITRDVEAVVAVFDVGGARVRTLHDGPLSVGRVELWWDGRTTAGRRVPPGVYFVRATLGDEVLASKLLRR
jgi:hypothetical protein